MMPRPHDRLSSTIMLTPEAVRVYSPPAGEGGSAGLSPRNLDAAPLAELEDLLIEADLGIEATGRVVQQLGRVRLHQDVSEDEIKELLAVEIERELTAVARPLALAQGERAV